MRHLTVSTCIYCIVFAPIVWVIKALAIAFLPMKAKRAFFTVGVYLELYGIKEPDEKCLLSLLKIVKVAYCPSSMVVPAILSRWLVDKNMKDNINVLKNCHSETCSSNSIQDIVINAPSWMRYGTIRMINDVKRLANSHSVNEAMA